MPKETFWDSSTAVEGDGSAPMLTVRWGEDNPVVTLNGVPFDRSGLNRLIQALVKARNSTFGADANLTDRVVRVTVNAESANFAAAIEKATRNAIKRGIAR